MIFKSFIIGVIVASIFVTITFHLLGKEANKIIGNRK